ncbi:MAG: pentapeptide repeat-containing protein [Hyphomicrobium sp.]|uniref:pentapeptide repeat-containing protein n=1 Tax=Hyphomicrobium sp. TaxID=82 RepID=UPI00132A79DE|nr:pentapeptide repeat-containing protein [Hyphomicrobium sp.]KAB2942355.1 MAG: pentapeptide repeat-containing protein [Hyphomicrobium sp.]MBZ0212124.1 pentapeptide repeat-containing protein [Hyphomicrobium sp.]MCZ7595533.1 pentapeptide repeat-containing protein [Hyphomicrobium sp.]
MKTTDAARPSLRRSLVLAAALLFSLGAGAEETEPVSPEADFTVRDITAALFKAKPGEPLDYSNHDLTYLDLSGLNFKGAKLAKSNLYGADFTGANLRGTDMSGTRLDRAVLIRADFSGANLYGASILRPTIYTDLTENIADAPRFAGANLTGIRVMANMSGADFHGADLTNANFTPREARPGQGTITTLAKNMLKSTDFTKAIARGANFDRAVLTFARFAGADLTGAKLTGADLSRADFTGADLTDADFTGADLDGATLLGVKGLDTVKGLSTALNFDKTIR